MADPRLLPIAWLVAALVLSGCWLAPLPRYDEDAGAADGGTAAADAAR